MIALTSTLAVDHIWQWCRVNAMCPGTVDSPWVARLITEAAERREDLIGRQAMGRQPRA